MPPAFDKLPQEVASCLHSLFTERRAELVDRATDWVYQTAFDLKGTRPKDETRKLTDKLADCYADLFSQNDDGPLGRFVEFATAYRADSEFRVSTLLRGFGSIRTAAAELIAPPQFDAATAFATLRVLDDAYGMVVFQVGDQYVEKLNATILQRRRELEENLERVAADRKREHAAALAEIARQRVLLNQVSLPIITVLSGVLVVPLIGELQNDRSEELMSRFLDAIVEHKTHTAILDLTGLSAVSELAARSILQTARAISLLGTRVLLVGITAHTAVALSQHVSEQALPPCFPTLADGLRRALATKGLAILPRSRS